MLPDAPTKNPIAPTMVTRRRARELAADGVDALAPPPAKKPKPNPPSSEPVVNVISNGRPATAKLTAPVPGSVPVAAPPATVVDMKTMLGSRTLFALQSWLEKKPEPALTTELLHEAVRKGYVEAFKMLVRFGAIAGYQQIHQKIFDSKKYTLFDSAVLGQNKTMLDLLNEYDCPLQQRSRVEMVRAIQVAARVGGADMLELLCSAAECMGIKWLPDDMRDFFIMAVQPLPGRTRDQLNTVGVMKFFLLRYPNSFDGSVYPTPLQIAVNKGAWESSEFLLGECGANPHLADAQGVTLMMMAAEKGHLEIYNLLRFHEASPHVTDSKKNTVLHYAIKGHNKEIVLNLVLYCRVDVHAKNENNVSPYDMTSQLGKAELREILLGSPNNRDINL